MRNRILTAVVAVLMAAGAVAHADTVVRKSGEVVRGKITQTGPFLEVETYDGDFLMLRKDEVRSAVRAGGEVIARNETKAQKQQRKQKQQVKQKDSDEYVVMKSGEKVWGNITVYGDVVELKKPGEGFEILSKREVTKVVSGDTVLLRSKEVARPLPEPIQVGSVMYRMAEGDAEEDMGRGAPGGPGGMGPGGREGGFGAPGGSGRGRGFGSPGRGGGGDRGFQGGGGFGSPGRGGGGDRGFQGGGGFGSPERGGRDRGGSFGGQNIAPPREERHDYGEGRRRRR